MDAVRNFYTPQPSREYNRHAVKSAFVNIIENRGLEYAKDLCWNIVKEQRDGKSVKSASKIFYKFFPSSKTVVTFQFIDGAVIVSTDIFEALKKDSELIRNLCEDTNNNTFHFAFLNIETFVSLLDCLYEHKSPKDLFEFAFAVNYLNIKRAHYQLFNSFKKRIYKFRTIEDLPKAFKFYRKIQKLPSPLKEEIEEMMGRYFGRLLCVSPEDKKIQLIQKYKEVQVASLYFDYQSNMSIIIDKLSLLITLRDLTLACIPDLKDEDFAKLPRNLKKLQLPQTPVSARGISLLPPDLLSLNLSHCISLTDIDLKFLPIHLTHLDLSHCINISNLGLKWLPQGLLSLVLIETRIYDNGLENLPKTIISIDLSHTDITDAGLSFLPIGMQKLRLNYCKEISIDALSRFSSLILLELGGTFIANDLNADKKLEVLYPQNTDVNDLSLRDRSINLRVLI